MIYAIHLTIVLLFIEMTDQRFKYYTGYEVDNEPSDDDEDDLPCNTAITNANDNNSDR